MKNIYEREPIFASCSIYRMLFITDIFTVTDSQMRQYFGILDCIAVYSFRIMKQRGAHEEQRNIHVDRSDVQVGTHKVRAIYMLQHSSMA